MYYKEISLEEGHALGIRDTAKNLLKSGVDTTILRHATGLTVQQLASLR